MKLSQIKLGGRYTAKVSGKLTVVRVLSFDEHWTSRGSRTLIRAVNEATGREITIRSPQRLRSVAEKA